MEVVFSWDDEGMRAVFCIGKILVSVLQMKIIPDYYKKIWKPEFKFGLVV